MTATSYFLLQRSADQLASVKVKRDGVGLSARKKNKQENDRNCADESADKYVKSVFFELCFDHYNISSHKVFKLNSEYKLIIS